MPFFKKKVQKSQLTFNNWKIQVKRRSFQRSINVSIKPNNDVVVTCGLGISDKKVLSFVQQHESWLHKQSEKFEQLRDENPPVFFGQDQKILFMGREYPINILDSAKKRTSIQIQDYVFNVEVNKDLKNQSTKEQLHEFIKKDMIKFYRKSAQEILSARVDLWSQKMGLKPSKLSFRSQKTRWGSCSSEGHISLNWKLVAAPIEVMDYVIIHELAHLKHQDHSRRFWNVVEVHCENYKEHKKWLRTNTFSFDFLLDKSEIHPN